MEESKRFRPGCVWVLVVLQFVGLLVLLFVVGVLAVTCVSLYRPAELAGMGADEYPDLKEVWSCGSGHTKVVGIPLEGMIVLGEDTGFFPSLVGTADMALKSVRRATHDREVQAVIISIDSGGGGITASDIIYKALMDFKAAGEGRKVVAICGDTAASGAYYVALAADRIVGHPTTVTGSIGVLIQTINMRELGEKIGVRNVTIKSGKNKDMLNPLAEFTEEQRGMLQVLVDELHDRFVIRVAEDRNLPEPVVRDLADGRVFMASKAMELGLVDRIGYWEDAVAIAAELLHVDRVKVYRYEQKFSFSSFLKAFRTWDPVSALLSRMSRTRLLYLWQL